MIHLCLTWIAPPLGAYAMMVACAVGQDAPQIDPVKVAQNNRGVEVYLNDSFEASDALARVRTLVARQRWEAAARLLQEASDEFGDSLIRITPEYYVGLRRYISDQIAEWPAIGIAAYRTLYERELEHALTRLSATDGIDAPLRLFDRFFCTAGAARLADRIGQRAIESGDLALAQRVYSRVLEGHPDAGNYESSWRATLAIIRSIGEPASAPDDATDQHAVNPVAINDTTIRWMGRDRSVRDVIVNIGASFAAVRDAQQVAGWPIFGGNAARNRTDATSVDELGLLWRYSFSHDDSDLPTMRLDHDGANGSNAERALSAYPVVSGGKVFIQLGRKIVALRRHTGEPIWRFRAEDRVADESSFLEDQPPGWDSVTVDGGRVYASLPGDAVPYYSYDAARLPHELVCLNAETGKLIWRTGRHATDGQFAEIHFDSSPIVRGGSLYVIGRRRRAFGFEDVYLYRYRSADGRFEHRTHLGSASTGSFGSRPATKSIIALHGDTVFVCTNLGSIAAVSAHSGSVRWLRLYDRRASGADRRSVTNTADVRSWQFDPLILSDGRLIARPRDGSSIWILDARSGDVLHEIPTSDVGDLTTLFGVRRNLICGAGTDVTCYDLDSAEVVWSKPLRDGGLAFGRGVWAGDRLLVPTRRELSAYRVLDGERTDAPWVTDGQGGNLLATPDTLFVSSAGSLSAYVRKATIWQKLRERMASAPNDPIPAIEFAEVALHGGEDADAISALREAVRRCDESTETVETVASDRLFVNVIRFAEELTERAALDDEALDTLFTYASRFASDTAKHLEYRLRFAKLFEQRDRPQRSVDLYQQILRDRSLRDLPVASDTLASLRGAAFAESRIDQLIRRLGSSVYQSHDRQAAQWLRRALVTDDVDLFERIVTAFPNSDVAAEALDAHGSLLMRSGRAELAAKRWTDAYHRYGDRVDRPSLMRRIADAYESAGQMEHAYRWLTKAAREHPGAIIEDQGRLVTLRQYRRHLDHVRTRVEPTRPLVTLPLDQQFVRTFDGSITLMSPRFHTHPAHRWNRCFVLTDDGIRSLNPRDGTDRWDKPIPVGGETELLITTERHAVFADGYRVFALDRTNGATSWSYGRDALHRNNPNMDWEQADALRLHALHGDRLVSVRESGEMTCIAVNTGALLWTHKHRPIPSERIHVAHDSIVYHVVEDGRTVLCIVDLDTGAWRDAIVTDVARAVEDVFVTLDGQIIVITSRSILSIDAETHAIRWHTELDGHLWRSSLLVELDALYFSLDGRELQKISLNDGHRVWRTDGVAQRGDDELTVEREGNSLIVSTNTSVIAVDPVTGLALWRGTTGPRPRLASRLITRSYVIAVDLPNDGDDDAGTVYCYDHRNASGLIPQNGAPTFKPLDPVRTIMATDGALLFQTENAIQGLTHK